MTRLSRSQFLKLTGANALILINLSIVGLRQHTGIDVAAGLLLGGCAGWIYSAKRAEKRQPS